MAWKEKSLMRQLIEKRWIRDMDGVYALVRELTAGLIQECMDAELEEELDYSRYDYKNKRTDNSRNGSCSKTVSNSRGEIDPKVPRDRKGEYEPQLDAIHYKVQEDGKSKILAERAEKPRCKRHLDCVSGWIDRLFGSHCRRISPDGNPMVHHPPNSQLYPLCIV